MIKRIAVVKWYPVDGISNAFHDELTGLGYEPVLFPYYDSIPADANMVLSFAPYNKFLPLASQMERFNSHKRAVFVHWNTENPPDPSIPWAITKRIAWLRSWLDRLSDSPKATDRFMSNLKPVRWIRQRMFRYRYVGDNQYAYRKGWLDLLVEASQVYAQLDYTHGIPAVFVPWGTCSQWHADLKLERDIDVLWFGKRRTKRRSDLIDSIRRELQAQGVKMMVVDGVERPYIFGEERTEILNRTKITINLLTQPYEYVCPFRFHVVAGNRCMVISEPEPNHHPACIPGKHLITSHADEMVEKILYYLSHEDERKQIAENAYQLVTQELTLANSLRSILRLAEDKVRLH